MIYRVSDLKKEVKEYICKSYYYNNVSIDEICSLIHASRNTIICVLNEYYKRNCKRELQFVKEVCRRDELPSFKTDAQSILIIADTHIGSRLENLKYIDEAYETGVKLGVDLCLHLGDIIQAELNHSDKPIAYQLDILENYYPEPSEFMTEVLLGNHDFRVFETNPEAKKILESKKQMNVLGYKRAYFDWCNYMFAMEHKVKHFDDELPYDDVALNFTGHGHELKIKSDARLKTPTLSDDIINKTNGAYPAFLIANMEDEKVFVDVYNFKDNKAKVRKKNFYTRELIDSYKVA